MDEDGVGSLVHRVRLPDSPPLEGARWTETAFEAWSTGFDSPALRHSWKAHAGTLTGLEPRSAEFDSRAFRHLRSKTVLGPWKTLAEVDVPDIIQFVKDATAAGQEVHIGTDSLQSGRKTEFVTVVVIHTPSKGGRVVYCRDRVPRIASLRQRLLEEVWRSVRLAMSFPGETKLTVHIDANPDTKYMSSRYLQELTGLVVGQGFKALWKPDSWAASHAADHVVRAHGSTALERIAA